MNKEKIEQHLSSLKGAESSYPFGPEALVFKVMGKMYALVSQQEEVPRVTLKAAPADAEVLVDLHDSISPGYYMNKKHWITLSLTGELPAEMIEQLATTSYDLVVSKLTRKDRETLSNTH